MQQRVEPRKLKTITKGHKRGSGAYKIQACGRLRIRGGKNKQVKATWGLVDGWRLVEKWGLVEDWQWRLVDGGFYQSPMLGGRVGTGEQVFYQSPPWGLVESDVGTGRKFFSTSPPLGNTDNLVAAIKIDFSGACNKCRYNEVVLAVRHAEMLCGRCLAENKGLVKQKISNWSSLMWPRHVQDERQTNLL